MRKGSLLVTFDVIGLAGAGEEGPLADAAGNAFSGISHLAQNATGGAVQRQWLESASMVQSLSQVPGPQWLQWLCLPDDMQVAVTVGVHTRVGVHRIHVAVAWLHGQ